MVKWLACFIAVLSTSLSLAQNTWGKVVDNAKAYEIRPMEQPEWAKRKDTPLFRVAWLSDMHMGQANARGIPTATELTTAACKLVSNSLKPDFAIITGDNCLYYPQDATLHKSISRRRQLWLQNFLLDHLTVPYYIIPGDNWPFDFDKVFGSTHYSIDVKGFHFQFNASDMMSTANDGCVIFQPASLEWMKRDLDANADRPCIYVQHEPVWPPSFLDAPKVVGILGRRPQVVAALAGHLHLDLELEHGSYKSVIAPAVGKSHRPGFKHMLFFRDLILLESYEWDVAEKTFKQAPKWQKIDIPEKFRNPPEAKPEQTSSLPPAPKVIDETLSKRYQEVCNNFLGFILAFGLKQFTAPQNNAP